jgi:ABC-type multidrug transport system fused ATPase/permease subunit
MSKKMKMVDNDKHNPINDLPRYIKIFQSYLGKKIYLTFLLTIFAGLAEGFGILMLLPLFQDLGTSLNFEIQENPSKALFFVQKVLLFLKLDNSIITLLIIISITFFIKGILTFFALAYGSQLRGEFLKILKVKMLKCINQAEYNYFSNKDTGNLINIINEQANRSIQSFYYVTLLGAQFFNSFIYLGFALFVAFYFGLMALIAGICLSIIFKIINVYVRKISRGLAEENGTLSKFLIQTLHAFKYLISTNQMYKLEKNIIPSISRLSTFQVKAGISAALTNAIREPVAVLFIMIVVIVQIIYLGQPIGPMLVSIVFFHRGLSSVLMTQGNWQSALEFVGSLELIDAEFKNFSKHREATGEIEINTFSKNIIIENMCYKYERNTHNIIDNISMNISAKTSIALIGESGSGKSTLVDIITLMLKPQSGKIIIDNIDSKKIKLNTWRDQIGYVSQESVVFNDTISNNICLWTGNHKKDKKLFSKIKKAAFSANLETFINGLPDGYDTFVGDRGTRLSGGQRQRLFIARELFRQPKLLILDEATSALDSKSERAIQKSIDLLKGKITIIIIAHRLSTIRNVDVIYLIENGNITESGSFEELMKKEKTEFKKIADEQNLLIKL